VSKKIAVKQGRNLPGVELVQARVPARRQCRRNKFHALRLAELNERSPNVFKLKNGTVEVGVPVDFNAPTRTMRFNSSAW